MKNIQNLLCEMQIQGQTRQAATSLQTIQVLKYANMRKLALFTSTFALFSQRCALPMV